MQKIYTTLALCLIISSQLFAKNGITPPADSLVKIKPDSIIKAQRDSVLAPPIGFENRQVRSKNTIGNAAAMVSISMPSILSPTNSNMVYGTSVSLYWNKNNNLGSADYFVKVVDLTTTTILYNYISVGDLASFEARNLVAGRTYSWLVRAVSRSNSSDVLETAFSNFMVSNTSVPTLALTSISATNFCGSSRSITLGYSRTGNFNAGNINFNYYYYYGNMYVELSNKDGDFINPTFITGTYSNANSGTFSVTLPDNLPFGQNYKIRLFSYGNIITSNTSAVMTIGTVGNPSVLNKFESSVDYSSLYLCANNTATVHTNLTDSSNVVFQWKKDNVNITTGGNYSKYTITTAGRYSVSITQGTCQTVSSNNGTQVYASSGNNSTSLLRDGNIIQCTGGSSKLTMQYWADNQTYKWYKDDILISGETQRTYNATQSGVYTVKVIEGNCVNYSTSDALIFGSSISVSSSIGAMTICSTGGQTSASVSPAYSPNLVSSYQWKKNGVNISGATSSSYTITQAGVYNAEVVQGGCVAISQGYEVKTSTTLDSIKIVQDIPNYCNSTNVYLYPSIYLQNASYRWKNTGITVNTNSSHTAIEDGNYTLTVTQGTCSTTSKTLALVLNTNREITLYMDGNAALKKDTIYICSDSPKTIYVNGYSSGTYQWFKDNVAISGATSSSYYTSQRGSYTFQVTSGSCIILSKPIFVETTLPKFSLNISPANNSVCGNNIYTLDYYNKGIYPYYCSSWKKDGIVFNTCANQVNVLETGIYTATVQQGSCVVESEALKISIGEPVSATISGNSTVTSGSLAKMYVSFTGASPWTFTLSDGTTITTSKNPYILTINPTVSTNYTLTSVMGSCGTGTVSGSASVIIGTCATPTLISVQPTSKTKCTGSSVAFSVTATGGGTLTYQWKKDGQNVSGANAATLTINNLKPTDLGNYAVEVTGTCETILSDVAVLKMTNDVPFFINPTSVVTTVGSNISFNLYTYNSVPVTGFIWQGPNGFTSNIQNPIVSNISINGSGNYTAFASNSQGCVGQAVAAVTVFSPSITINSLSKTTFCPSQTGTISFTPPSGVTTTYAVQLSYSDGSFSTNPTTLGTGNSSPITFTVPSNNLGSTSNYRLRIIDTQNLTQVSSPSAVISVVSLTVSLRDVVGKSYINICSGSSIKLYAKMNMIDNADVVYEWKKNGVLVEVSTSSTYITNQIGSYYTVKATQPNCGNATSSQISINSTDGTGGFYQTPDTYQCAGSVVELSANYNSEGVAYVWRKDGVLLSNQNRSLTITQSGTYNLLSSDPNCFYTYADTKKIVLGSAIAAVFGGSSDTIVTCSNNGVYLGTDSRSGLDYSYQWVKDGVAIPGATNYYYYVYSSGVYSFKLNQGSCSASSRTIVVNTNGIPSNIIKAKGGTNICSGTAPTVLEISGSACGNFQWQKDQVDIPSQSNSQFIPTLAGSYRLKITTNTAAVTYSNSIDITVGNTANYLITSSDTITCTPNAYLYLNYYNLPNSTFQWIKNNVDIPGSTSSSYYIGSNGSYKIKVTVGSCIGYSQQINFIPRNYLSKPIISSDEGKIICNNSYTRLKSNFNLPSYSNAQWKKNGVIIPNETSPYTISVAESGNYSLKVIQGSCNAESDAIKINIGDKQQSIKTSDWNSIATWSCGTIPTVVEDVLINKTHIVTLPNGYTGFLKNLENNGSVIQGANSRLNFLQN